MRKICLLFLVLFFVFCVFVVTSAKAQYKISYNLHQPGTVSFSVFNGQGRLIKQLLVGKKEKAGKHYIEWDGTNIKGKPVKPGKYYIKGIDANLKVKYWMTVGNTEKPPYPTLDGSGDWGGWNPSAVASGGKNWYILFRMQEGEGALIKVNRKGRIIWKTSIPGNISGYNETGQMALAIGKKYVYVAGTKAGLSNLYAGFYQPQDGLWRVKKQDGSYVPWENGKIVLWLDKSRSSNNPLTNNEYISDYPLWQKVRAGNCKYPYPLVGVRGLAVKNGDIYVPFYFKNSIGIYNENGEKIREITGIEKPEGIAFNKNGDLLVVSGNQILKLIITSGNIYKLKLINKDLSAPCGIVVDKQGNIYVTDLLKSQQIKKFSSTGRLLLTIGKKGGDVNFSGSMTPYVLHFPLGIAVNNYGEICVADSGVPGAWYGGGSRDLVYTSKGKFLHDWFNPGGTAGDVAINGKNPQWLYTGSSGLYGFKVNLNDKKWKWTDFWFIDSPDGGEGGIFWGPHRLIIPLNSKNILLIRKGQQYLFCPGINTGIFKIIGNKLIPCVAVGSLFPKNFKKGWQPDLKMPLGGYGVYVKVKHGFTYRYSTGIFLWEAKNGNGKVEKNEITFGKTKADIASGGGSEYIDNRFNMYLEDLSGGQSAYGTLYELPCLGFNKYGVPQYSLSKMKILIKNALLPETIIPGTKNQYYGNYDFYPRVYKGNVYIVNTTTGASKGLGWAANIHRSKLSKWNKNGKLLWRIGKKATGFAKPGESYRYTNISGITKGFVFCTDVAGPERVFTTDGLYAGSLLKDQYKGPVPNAYLIQGENFCHRVFTDKQTGQTWLAGGFDGVRFYKIMGLNHAQRFQSTITLTKQQVSKVSQTTQTNRKSLSLSSLASQKLQVSFVLPLTKTPEFNGILSGWGHKKIFSGPITPDITDTQMMKREAAWVWTRWDKKNLYIVDKVNDLTPLVNLGRLTRTWWYGDSLQVRLLISGKPMQLGLYYDSQGKKYYIEKSYGGPMGYDKSIYNLIGNPKNIEEQLNKEFPQGIGYTGTGAELKAQIYPNKKGYIMEAKIPWKYLNPRFNPEHGSIFRMGLQQNWSGINPTQDSNNQFYWGGAMPFSPPTSYAPAILLPEPTSHTFAIVKVPSNKIKINGNLKGWPTTDIADIKVPGSKGKNFKGDVYACYSSKYFYVAFLVNDTTPMENAGGDIRTAFQTGDACEIYLSTNQKANPNRTQPIAGDYRIVMTYLENHIPTIAAFIPVVPGKKQKYVTSSGGQAPLDEVEEIPGAKMFLKRRTDGYILEAAIPWKYFGIKPKPGFITKGDFAIDFSGPAGRHTVLKLYWAEGSSMQNDLAQEEMFHPDRWGWFAFL